MAPARDKSAAAAEARPRVCHAAGILGWQLVDRTLMIRPSYVPRDDSCSGVPITEAFRATAGKWLEASLEARWSPRRKTIAGWRVGAPPLIVSSASRCPRGEPAKHSLASCSAGLSVEHRRQCVKEEKLESLPPEPAADEADTLRLSIVRLVPVWKEPPRAFSLPRPAARLHAPLLSLFPAECAAPCAQMTLGGTRMARLWRVRGRGIPQHTPRHLTSELPPGSCVTRHVELGCRAECAHAHHRVRLGGWRASEVAFQIQCCCLWPRGRAHAPRAIDFPFVPFVNISRLLAFLPSREFSTTFDWCS